MAGFLRMSGLEVVTAGDGSDALDYLRKEGRPDVVLLDMGLPRFDGAATLKEIRRTPALAGLKVFAVSGAPRRTTTSRPARAASTAGSTSRSTPSISSRTSTASWTTPWPRRKPAPTTTQATEHGGAGSCRPPFFCPSPLPVDKRTPPALS